MKISQRTLISYAKKNKTTLSSRKICLKIFDFIFFLKLIEDQLEKNYHPNDKMKCPVHFCHGQEAVPAALHSLLSKKDYLFSHHRSHGYYLSKKCPPEKKNRAEKYASNIPFTSAKKIVEVLRWCYFSLLGETCPP